ncbi:DUF7305 domain-containing protein [Rummeliibacillus sp. JY-2-4R]
MKRKLNPISNENGYTLIIVIMVLVVISILGLGLMGTSATTLKQSDNERIDQATYYIAEAGLVQKREGLKQIIQNSYQDTLNHYNNLSVNDKAKFDFEGDPTYGFYAIANAKISSPSTTIYSSEATSGENKVYERQYNKPTKSVVTVQKVDSNSRIYIIKSTGTIANHKSRTVKQELIVDLHEDSTDNNKFTSKYAVHVKNSIFLDNNSSISGEIATESLNPSISGKGTIPRIINKGISLPTLPEFPLYSFDSSKNADEIITDDNGNLVVDGRLVINVENSNKKISINNLTINNNGSIVLIGPYKLNVYIKGNVIFGNNVELNPTKDPIMFSLIYEGENTIDFPNNINLNGSLFTKNSAIEIKNNLQITGGIYSYSNKNIAIKNNSIDNSLLIFAPSANVEIKNNANFKGSIIANSLSIENNNSIVYGAVNAITGTNIPDHSKVIKLSSQSNLLEETE